MFHRLGLSIFTRFLYGLPFTLTTPTWNLLPAFCFHRKLPSQEVRTAMIGTQFAAAFFPVLIDLGDVVFDFQRVGSYTSWNTGPTWKFLFGGTFEVIAPLFYFRCLCEISLVSVFHLFKLKVLKSIPFPI